MSCMHAILSKLSCKPTSYQKVWTAGTSSSHLPVAPTLITEMSYTKFAVLFMLTPLKSTATMSRFKQELLTWFQGTDEGEVKEYLGCEVIRDRAARTGKMVQAGYAERVLRTFGMWNCNPVLTPLDPNVRLTKRDSPDVVDPRLHRRMRSIVGCLSYLVNMTRPDLAFTYFQLSKFVL